MSITAMCSIPGIMHKLPGGMRLVTYELHRGPRAGVVHDGGVVDLWDALGGGPPQGPTVGALLRPPGIQAPAAGGGPARGGPRQGRPPPPGPRPPKRPCAGPNFRAHT